MEREELAPRVESKGLLGKTGSKLIKAWLTTNIMTLFVLLNTSLPFQDPFTLSEPHKDGQRVRSRKGGAFRYRLPSLTNKAELGF